MFAAVAFAFSIIIAWIVLAATRSRGPAPRSTAGKPSALGWLTLAFGLIAAAAFAFGALIGREFGVTLASITCAFAAVIVGIGALVRRERLWPTWAGLAAGTLPALAWILFAVAHLFDSGA